MTGSEEFSLAGKRVYIAGHKGMVGQALMRRLESEHCTVISATKSELDLRDQAQVRSWMSDNRPEVVFVAAAKVGGIKANNDEPAKFLYDNLMIEANIINSAHESGVEKLIFLGSTCIYPKMADQPIVEEALLTGPLEPSNEWYALAKIAGIKLCQAYRREYGSNFIAAQPTNLYGPNDNYDLEKSHVLPALLRKTYEAKKSGSDSVAIWGSGTPLREFLHVDDLADALVFLAKTYSDYGHINIGSGNEVSIRQLATMIANVVGFNGNFEFDKTKLDGTPRKLCDVTKLREMGWSKARPLSQGLVQVYQDFLREHGQA